MGAGSWSGKASGKDVQFDIAVCVRSESPSDSEVQGLCVCEVRGVGRQRGIGSEHGYEGQVERRSSSDYESRSVCVNVGGRVRVLPQLMPGFLALATAPSSGG